ncbi:hypothetical protein dsat_2780 [Alkalidesulfovibrio alkalitolerans DSM 16529]|jgi:hypothetical protein|uniref:Uncharacterized protein n=1 Tax=Alkalidesulfovibrio alkalitolerans DSM 16529 TaxID=1121439 RepID=S7UQA3_9BACT|nr:hypothetical protein dsat_2780 [Alkalidesulfovibrio alkalitolerans DSM 16529]
MERCVKTARMAEELAGTSMTRLVAALEDYAAQRKSVLYLREHGQNAAAEKLRAKVVADLGQAVAAVIDEGYARPRRTRGKVAEQE